jgi:hypothetical protein
VFAVSVEIQENRPAIEMDKALLKQGMDEYCSCKLFSLGSVIPVSGSNVHDGMLASNLADALRRFREVVYEDVGLIENTANALEQADEASARAIEAG